MADLRGAIRSLSGVSVSLSTGFNPGEKQIQLQVYGTDAQELTRLAQTVADQVRQTPGAVDISLSTKGQKPELDVQLDRGLAGSLGVTVGEVAQALRPAFAGIDVGDWIDPSGETRDVTIRLAPESRTVGRRSRIAAAAGRRTGKSRARAFLSARWRASRRPLVRRGSIISIATA